MRANSLFLTCGRGPSKTVRCVSVFSLWLPLRSLSCKHEHFLVLRSGPKGSWSLSAGSPVLGGRHRSPHSSCSTSSTCTFRISWYYFALFQLLTASACWVCQAVSRDTGDVVICDLDSVLEGVMAIYRYIL